MNKKLLLGSILVLTLLLLMPSIPAIQQKLVKDEILSEISEDLYFKDTKGLLKSIKLNGEKYPLLLLIVILICLIREKQFIILLQIAIEPKTLELLHPKIFLWCLFLLIRLDIFIVFFDKLSHTLGWNWKYIVDYLWEITYNPN